MTDRIFSGYVFRCLSCNKQLSQTESVRTYPESNELIGLCGNCHQCSGSEEYAFEFTQNTATEGLKPSSYVDSHSGYFYSYYDN